MKSYIKFLSRNRLYTIIEAFGLTVSLCFTILIGSYAWQQYSIAYGNPDYGRIYSLSAEDIVALSFDDKDALENEVPEVEMATRYRWEESTAQVADNHYNVHTTSVDREFFEMFPTGVDKALIDALESKGNILVSRTFANTISGSGEDIIGKVILFDEEEHVIAGVFDDFKDSIFPYCDILLNIQNLNPVYRGARKFSVIGNIMTLFLTREGVDRKTIEEKTAALCEKNYSSGWIRPKLHRLDELYFLDDAYILKHTSKSMLEVLTIVALALLLSSVFNYINLSTALCGKRAKEMAVRRLLGAGKGKVFFSSVAESVAFTAVCCIAGLLLAVALTPAMNSLLVGEDAALFSPLSIAFSPGSIAIYLLLILVLGVLAGFIPARIISQYSPIDTVKGGFRFRSKMVFSKIFIVCQNVISTVLIAVALTMTLQMRHLVTLPTGYNTENLISLKTWSLGFRNMDAQDELARRLRALPQVETVGMAMQAPFACGSNGVHVENEKMSWLNVAGLDSTSFRLLGFRVLEKYSEPLEGTYWFTEEAKRRYGVSEENRTVGKRDDGTPEYECCGIIADYRSNDALRRPMEDSHNAVQNRTSICSCLIVKVIGDRKEAFDAVSDVWRGVAVDYLGVPKAPEISYVEDFLNSALTGTRNTMSLVSTFMVLAILISALGLFAMSVYYTDQQSRQIALRKIFGSDVRTAVWTLSRDFLLMAAVAVVIAAPLCVWAMRYYLRDFYNAIPFPWWVIPVAALLTLLIAAVSIFGQTWKSAAANPVDKLKSE